MRQNPLWSGKGIDVPETKREIFHRINKFMDYSQILAITGLRRVGKTTLMMQMINELLKSDINERNIMYVSFDHRIMQTSKSFEDIIEYFLTAKAENGKKYLFLDEIQKVDGWKDIVKIYYDIGEIKFIISGSASLQIKKAKESLSGRIIDFYVPPVSFSEYLNFIDKNFQTKKLVFPFKFDEIKKIYDENILKKENIEKHFIDYLFKGAFPELIKIDDEDFITTYINNSVVEKIVYQDIPEVFKIKREDLLYGLIEYTAKETGKIFNIESISKTLNADRNTITKYLFYLRNGFLVNIAYNYSKSLSKEMRKNKKIYVIHPSIAIAISGYKRDILKADEIAGYYVESLCTTYLSIKEKVAFFRDSQKHEVDIIVAKKDKLIPVEVKYRKYIRNEDVENLKFFIEKFKSDEGIVITKNVLKKEEYENFSITYIPIWLFLIAV